jgi:carboxypeptidase Q
MPHHHRTARRSFIQSLLLAPTLGLPIHGTAQTVPPFAEADLAHAAVLRDQALRAPNLAFDLMASLVTQVGPRAAGSANDAKAVQWALDNLRRLGFANVRAEPVPLVVWQRGATRAQVLAPEPREIVATALGNTVGTAEAAGVEAEVAYYSDFAALRADASEKARGRIVFIDQKTERSRDGSGYSRAILSRIAGAVEASRRGAVAVAIRSLGTDSDRIAHTGALRYDPQVAAIPAVAVSVPDADWIAERGAAPGGAPMRMRLQMARTARVEATSHNVIAEVPGSDLAHEIVLIGAHLDSWDITPGAQDDASGVGIVTAAAKAVLDGARRPRRTIRVVLFANEENGFDGANAYAAKYKDVAHQLVGESDFGADRIWRLRSRVADAALPAIAAMARLLEPLGIAAEGNQGSPGPDAGVLMRANKWPAIELTQDGSKYFDVHHTVNDTIDKVNPATMPQNVAAWAVVAWLAAQAEGSFASRP